jgi:glycosyltransferase involved in cell wall biosynthesis
MGESQGNDKPRMKVLHIIAINGIGGAENLLVDILPLLEKTGIAVNCMILFRTRSEADAHSIGGQLRAANIEVCYKEYTQVVDSYIVHFILDYIREIKPDIIHTHLKQAELWMAYLTLTGKVSIPLVTTCHGYRDDYLNKHGLIWNWKIFFTGYYWVNRFIYRLFNLIMISHALEKFFRRSGFLKRNRYTIVHHGTEFTEVPRDLQKPFRYEIALPGRMIKHKGHEYLIQAVSLLKKDFPELSAHFYGIGPEMDELVKMTEEMDLVKQIKFHGFVRDVVNRIAEHDIAVIPSTGEAFGLVFFDSFKANLPVVAFDLPPSNEIIQDGYNGLLAKPLDPQSLANKISSLFLDRNLREDLILNAKKTMHTRFSLQVMANRYRDFYSSILAKRVRQNYSR